jgi:hypothetical protein
LRFPFVRVSRTVDQAYRMVAGLDQTEARTIDVVSLRVSAEAGARGHDGTLQSEHTHRTSWSTKEGPDPYGSKLSIPPGHHHFAQFARWALDPAKTARHWLAHSPKKFCQPSVGHCHSPS